MISINARFACCLLVVAVSWATGCEGPGSQEPDAKRGTLQREVAAIWDDAKIEKEAGYQRIAKNDDESESIAPADMSAVTVLLAEGRTLRNWPNQVTFTCSDQRIRVSWTGGITSTLDGREALERFDAAMKERGYQVLVESKAVAEMGDRLGLPAEGIARWANSQHYQGYTRKVGQTEIAALAEAINYTGGRDVSSGIRFQWFVVRSYPHPQPTLAEALGELPGWFRAPYLPAALYEALAGEEITECSAGHGISIDFEKNVSDTLVKSLEGDGFEYDREHELRDRTQKTWSRYADDTFAHVITIPGSEGVRFTCQAPQRKGKPRTGKRPARHPSLSLPASKRPVLELDQLTFADPKLKQQTRYFQDLADGIAEDGWFVQRYKDVRYSAEPRYVATWETTRMHGGQSFLESALPYRGMEITLTGPAAADPAAANAEEKIVSLSVRGRWVPELGWAAMVNYSPDADCWAWVGLVSETSTPRFSFMTASPDRLLRLSRNTVAVTTPEEGGLRFEYKVRLPYDAAPEAMAERRRKFFQLYTSPQSLRDTVLEDLEELQRIATDQIARSEGITAMDYTNLWSDYPPRPVPDSASLISEAVRKALLELVLARLDAQRKLVLDNYREMHAAVTRALPLNESELP